MAGGAGKVKAMAVTSSRPAAVRYEKAFDSYISVHPEHAGIKAVVAFSGKLTGKDVMHSMDDRSAWPFASRRPRSSAAREPGGSRTEADVRRRFIVPAQPTGSHADHAGFQSEGSPLRFQ